jgi:hypothetical protein
VLLTLRRLCKEYHALPSQVLAEDAGLLLQLLEVDAIVNEAEAEYLQQQAMGESAGIDPGLAELERMAAGG